MAIEPRPVSAAAPRRSLCRIAPMSSASSTTLSEKEEGKEEPFSLPTTLPSAVELGIATSGTLGLSWTSGSLCTFSAGDSARTAKANCSSSVSASAARETPADAPDSVPVPLAASAVALPKLVRSPVCLCLAKAPSRTSPAHAALLGAAIRSTATTRAASPPPCSRS